MIIKNELTGKKFVVDPKMSRVRHLQRRVHAWAEVCKPFVDDGRYEMKMCRLSIAIVDNWYPRMISEFMYALRGYLGASLVSYAWVAELQERGAVHYHLLLVVLKHTKIPYFDKSGMWVWGSTRIETARSPFYVCSYTRKENYQKFGVFPKGLRMFAVWVERGLLSQVTRFIFHLSVYPRWLEAEVLRHCEGSGWNYFPRRRKGGGWQVGGKLLISPFSVVSF